MFASYCVCGAGGGASPPCGPGRWASRVASGIGTGGGHVRSGRFDETLDMWGERQERPLRRRLSPPWVAACCGESGLSCPEAGVSRSAGHLRAPQRRLNNGAPSITEVIAHGSHQARAALDLLLQFGVEPPKDTWNSRYLCFPRFRKGQRKTWVWRAVSINSVKGARLK